MKYCIKKNTPTIPFEKKWQFCVGSGQAALALRTDYTRQLCFIREELGIQRVRFHGILNDEMKTLSDLSDVLPFGGSARFPERSFHQCGVAYDNVLAAGMKPFVELSFLPKRLCKPSGDSLVQGATIGEPKSLEVWTEYVRAFIKYLIHRYGLEEILTWYFEVWNEPDLQGAFFYGTQQDYFDLYEATARMIKGIHPKLMVGGPSTSGSKWIPAFVTYCREREIPLDFVTTHQYAGDPLTGVTEDEPEIMDLAKMMAHMTESIDQLPDDARPLDVLRATLAGPFMSPLRSDVFRKNAAIVQKQAQGLPVYYTEWNTNATFGAYGNDTRLTAAYDVKNALDTERYVAGSSIWCFSDIFDEMHQFTEEFHGGFGMLTLNGIPKPVFYGMKMLEMAGEYRYDLGEDATLGEVGIAAFYKQTDVAWEKQVLLFRQKMTDEALEKEAVSVELELDREPGTVSVYRIDENHANPLRLWEEMGQPTDLNRNEIEQLRSESAMREEPLVYTYCDGVLTVKAELAENDLWFICIRG